MIRLIVDFKDAVYAQRKFYQLSGMANDCGGGKEKIIKSKMPLSLHANMVMCIHV
jgi:hypothetical protein